MNLTTASICRIENGLQAVTEERLRLIAGSFGLSMAEFYSARLCA